MRRLLAIIMVVALLLALTPVVAYASSHPENGDEDQGKAIGQVVGTLGLYAAMMAVLAVGAEVVIDAVRPIFGLKRKKTASEALEELRDWLPGTLKDLDVSPDMQLQLDEQLDALETLTTQFEDQAESVHRLVRDQIPELIKDLAIHSVEDVLERGWQRLEPRLKAIDPDLDTEEVRAWLKATLKRLEEADVNVAVHLKAVSTLLDGVREQNNQLRGPLRKLWRWLRDSFLKISQAVERNNRLPQWLRVIILFLCRIPAYPGYFWAWMKGKLPEGDTFGERLRNLSKHERFAPLLTMEEAAKHILAEDTRYEDGEKSRIVWLRILSAVVGIALAATLQVDSLRLLEPILGSAADAFRPPHEAGQTVDWYTFGEFLKRGGAGESDPALELPGLLGVMAAALLGLTPGIILSGLGAAAGSGFWHDQLDKLRSAKETIAQVEELTGKIQG